MMNPWDAVNPTIPPTAPDFEKPVHEPPARPVNIPADEGEEME